MKEYIVAFMSHANKLLQTSTEEFKHGLSISVKPHANQDISHTTKGSITIDEASQLHDVNSVPDQFAELFEKSWLEKDDKVTLSIASQLQHISCMSVHKNTSLRITEGVHGLFIIAQKNSQSTINITSTTNTSIRMHIVCEENSSLTINHIQEGKSFILKKVHVKKDAQVYFNDVLTTNSYARLYQQVTLLGENSTAKQKVISLTYDDAIADIYTLSDHAQEHSYSDIITRSVITDSSKTLSRGLVKIQRMAAHSEGYEKQDALMLSKNCEADAIPNLEIHNHNVKCSHGSTVGRIDTDKLFYLMSRGLSESHAKKEIVKAYFQPILEEFADTSLHEHITNILEEKI